MSQRRPSGSFGSTSTQSCGCAGIATNGSIVSFSDNAAEHGPRSKPPQNSVSVQASSPNTPYGVRSSIS
jgi:hypothetical protein